MLTKENKKKEMSVYDACSIVEGFCGYEPTPNQRLRAWAKLIETGTCWSLQGWYGRNASSIIESGAISDKGKINWKIVKQLREN